MIHLPNGADWDTQYEFYDNVLAQNNLTLADFDIQGVSFYPFYGIDYANPMTRELTLPLGTTATLKNLANSLTQMADKYKKEIIVAETNWPVACAGGPTLSEPTIPVSVQGQTQWVKDIITYVSALPNSLGVGLFYWEPAWIGK